MAQMLTFLHMYHQIMNHYILITEHIWREIERRLSNRPIRWKLHWTKTQLNFYKVFCLRLLHHRDVFGRLTSMLMAITPADFLNLRGLWVYTDNINSTAPGKTIKSLRGCPIEFVVHVCIKVGKDN